MLIAARFVCVVALAVWLGETVFLSFVVAPTLFRQFPVHEAGGIMSALFPAYYTVGGACGVALIASTALLWRAGTAWKVASAISAVMLVAVLYAGLALQPRVRELRLQRQAPTADAQVEAEFDTLHRRSVQLNALVLAGGIALAGVVAARLRA